MLQLQEVRQESFIRMENKEQLQNIDGPERRTVTTQMEFREEGEEKYFEGGGILFNTVTDMGWYTEEIDPGAADDVMKDDVRGQFNHDSNYVLGRTKSGTMTLVKEPTGVRYKIKYNEKDPDHVSGSSFSFDVKDDEWSTRNGRDHRKIKKFKALYDIGPVTFPAYDKTTVAIRSKDRFKSIGDEYKKDLAEMDLQRMKRKRV